MYLFPFMILIFIDEALSINLFKYLEHLGPLRQIIGLLLLVYAMVLPGYRAKIASDAYGDGAMTLGQAHTVSGVILKTHLSFLPIIGFIFDKSQDDSSTQDMKKKTDNTTRFDE